MRLSAWKYYLPDDGETAEDSRLILLPDWKNDFIYDFEAAEAAAEDDWCNHDGWEYGLGEGPRIALLRPDGTETRWTTEREADVRHGVYLEEETTS